MRSPISDERFELAAKNHGELKLLTEHIRKHGVGSMRVAAVLAFVAVIFSPGNLGFPGASLAATLLFVTFFSIGYTLFCTSKVLVLFAASVNKE